MPEDYSQDYSLVPVEHDPFGSAPQGNVAGSVAGVAQGLGQRALNWWQNQPSWADRAGQADANANAAWNAGGPQAMLHQMVTDPARADLMGGFVGSTTEGGPPGIKAFHGSPHDFDAFDMSKIGTGEGAQAYGHGLYFAGNEDVAKSYRDTLAPSRGKLPDDIISLPPDMRQAVQTHAATDADAMTAAKKAQWMSANLRGVDQEKVADMIQRVRDAKTGKMYEVNINADPEHFLDWDKPLSEQHPKVQEAVNNFFPEGKTSWGYSLKNGEDVVRALGSEMRGSRPITSDPGAATEVLNRAGIPGIKYLDQGSRGTGAGTHNYVVFNDKLIDIARKYGLAGLIGGGAADFSLQPVDHDPYQGGPNAQAQH